MSFDLNLLFLLIIVSFFGACDIVEEPFATGGGTPVDTTSPTTFIKKILMEDYSGHTCSNCPNAARELDALIDIYGDKKEVIKLDILKKFMYTPYESEKRMATSVLWNRISNEFDVINVNKIVAMKIYCDDGLGKNIDYVRMLSSKSSSLFYSETLNSHGIVYSSYRYAFRMSINLIRYSIHSKSLEFIRKVNFNATNLSLLLSAIPFGLYLYLKDKYKYIARR